VIRLAHPWMLLAATPFVLFALWRLRRLPMELGRRRRGVQLLMASSVVGVALALGGLELGRRVDRLAVIFAVDRSRSVDLAPGETERALAEMRGALAQMRPGDRAGVVVFGASAATEVFPSPRPPLGQPTASVPRDATDIERGLRRALADLPAEHTGRVVLISDGVQTRGDALAAASLASGRGVVVDAFALERSPAPEVAVERVRVPSVARPGEPVEVRVVTRATRATPARVRVSRGGVILAETETVVREGSDVLVLRDEAPESGIHRYEVLVQPLEEGYDVGRANNEGGAFLRVVGGSRVLIAADEPAEARGLAEVVDGAGLEVVLVDSRHLPIDLGEMAGFDLLVLSDVGSRALGEAQMAALRSYVRDLGGGLLMTGARRSFGLGGYAHTPVEEALPATFDLRQRRDRLSLAMVIAIDNSGSMGMEVSPGRSKLDLANEAAARSALLLSTSDRVGVMHVDTSVTWTQPMASVQDPAEVAAAVRRASPGGGGILVDITLEAAYAALRAERTQLKHLLLFSDGGDSEQLGGCRMLVQRAVRERITTSIVSMGLGPDTPELERLSQIGGGRFYIVEDLTELPRIFTQETLEASRAALVEEPFRAVPVADGAPIRGIDFGQAPPLGGHAVLNARGRATVLLQAGDDEEAPLLLTWQFGVGRAGVFATDVGAEFARGWLSWSGYTTLFSQLARDLARPVARRDAQVTLSIDDGVGRLRVEAVSEAGRYRNYLDLAGTVAAPGGRRIEVELTQTGPGRYEGRFPAEAPGPYLATVRQDGGTMVGTAGVVRPPGGELTGEGTNGAFLRRLAALTGGQVRTSLRDVFVDRPPPTWAHVPLWPPLLALALCAMLLSVALRRLTIPAGLWRRLLPASARRRGEATARGTAPATVQALVASKRQRHSERAPEDRAPEIAAALDASPGSRPAVHEEAPAAELSPATPEDAPAEPAEGSEASLAERLLARKKRRP